MHCSIKRYNKRSIHSGYPLLMKTTICFFFSLLYVFTAFSQSKQQTENLETFARLYGYVKYFYPGDEAAVVDWEGLAVYGSGQVANARDSKELRLALNRIFLPIAPAMKLYSTGENAEFDLRTITPADTSGYKVVSWQHLGVGLGNQKNVYRSQRTNRPAASSGNDTRFGTIQYQVPAEKYKGNEFVLTAKVKVAQGAGSGHLWMRVDSEGGILFFDNMGNRPVKSSQSWKDCEIKGTVAANASQLVFGFFLGGEGELTADDLVLKIKKDGEWETVLSDGFENPESDRIKAFDKANSDYSLSIQKDSTKPDNHLLSIKEIPVRNSTVPYQLLFDTFAQPGEYIRKVIARDLVCVMPLALYGTPSATYPVSAPDSLEELQQALSSIPDSSMTGNDLYTRLGNIIITWNIFQHFYPYFDVAKTDWEKNLEVALQNSYTDKTAHDHLKTLERFTAHLKDGHVYVSSPLTLQESFAPPIQWEWIENKLVITSVLSSGLFDISPGTIVSSVNGISPQKWFENIEQNISAPSAGWRKHRSGTLALYGREGSELVLKINKPDETSETISLKRTLSIPSYHNALTRPDAVKELDEGIYYLNLDVIQDKAINDLLPQLTKAKGIICDLRGYPKSSPQFIKHLLSEKDTSSSWMQIPRIIYPDREKITGYQKTGWLLAPETPSISAKVVFITDGSAISYAESYLSFIKDYKLAVIVGQPTAGTNGNVNPFTLPGGYTISWTGMKVLKHDGTQHHGIGVIPDVYVEKTIAGVREGRDEFLEKALEIVRSK